MKGKTILIAMMAAGLMTTTASAQYSDIVNGITNAMMPALSGAASYKGFVETDFTLGVGKYRTSSASIATSQGYKFNEWFYMGAGIGVDLLWSTYETGWGDDWAASNPAWFAHEHTSTAVMIPVFTDFRFMLGSMTSTSFFINLRVGASFLCSDSYIKIRNGYLTNQNYFFFQPAFGVRIPVSLSNPKQAIDIGLHYRLTTSDYWSTWQYNATLNGIGLNVAFEW